MVFLGAIACVFLGGLSNASEPTPAYSPDRIDFPGTQIVYHVADTFPHLKSDLSYSESPRISSVQDQKLVWCKSVEDPKCDLTSIPGLSATSLLPYCENSASENCLQSVSIANNGIDFFKLEYEREIGGYTIPSDRATKLVGGRSASIWQSEQAPHTGGTGSYLIAARVASSWESTLKQFVQTGLSVSVIPFGKISGDYSADRWLSDDEFEESAKYNPQWKGMDKKYIPFVLQGRKKNECFFSDEGMCGVQYDFASDARVRLTLRVSKELGG